MRGWRAKGVPLLLSIALAAMACDDPTGPGQGAIRIDVAAEGDDIDETYLARVDGVGGRIVILHGEPVFFTRLSPGPHAAELVELTGNCAVTGQNPRSVSVIGGDTVSAFFMVRCDRRTGSLRVTTATTGTELDPDGFALTVDGGPPQAIGVNAMLELTGLHEGVHSLMLGGHAGNCAVTKPNPRVVDVQYLGTAEAAFTVQCVASGSLGITVGTTGTDLDPDGFIIELDGANFDTVVTAAPNQPVTVSILAPGDFQLTLRGVSPNCDRLGAAVRAASVVAGATTTVAFDVACSAATRIAFVSEWSDNAEIHVIDSDGTGAARLTTNTTWDIDPAWSGDGRIAFLSRRTGNGDIYIMNADGSGQTRLTTTSAAEGEPSWSPDGSRIVFAREVECSDGYSRCRSLFAMNADGSNEVRLTTADARDSHPDFAPDGARIAFARNGRILVMRTDGTGIAPLTNGNGDWQPAWSPDGSRIAFSRIVDCDYYGYFCDSDLFTMSADGSGLTLLMSGPDAQTDPAWSPDGRKIAFASGHCTDYYCYESHSFITVVGADGSDPVRLSDGDGHQPAWRR